eukprot:2203881-Lingulodinium_polyedra.AAC.1
MTGEAVEVPGAWKLAFSQEGWGYLQGEGGEKKFLREVMQKTLFKSGAGRFYMKVENKPRWLDQLQEEQVAKYANFSDLT